MNTSGTGTVFAIGYWVVLAMTIMCAVQLLGDLGPRLRAPRPAALALVAVVAVPSLIELGWHGIYTALSRQPDQINPGRPGHWRGAGSGRLGAGRSRRCGVAMGAWRSHGCAALPGGQRPAA
jgi:hypothetical protein